MFLPAVSQGSMNVPYPGGLTTFLANNEKETIYEKDTISSPRA
jgi:hypothetical protein